MIFQYALIWGKSHPAFISFIIKKGFKICSLFNCLILFSSSGCKWQRGEIRITKKKKKKWITIGKTRWMKNGEREILLRWFLRWLPYEYAK